MQNISQALRNQRLDIVQQLISYLPLEELPDSSFYQLLNELLTVVRTAGLPDLARWLFDHWSTIRAVSMNLEKRDYFSTLFLEPVLEVDNLRFLSLTLPTSFLIVLVDLIAGPDLDISVMAAERAKEVFPAVGAPVYQTLLEEANGKNISLYQWLFNEYTELADYAPIPQWIQGTADVKASQLSIPEIKVELSSQDLDKLVDQLLKSYGSYAPVPPKAAVELRAHLQLADRETRSRLLEPILGSLLATQLDQDRALFRLYGPDNPEPDATIEDLQYHRYRMFNYNDLLDEDDELPTDWFSGVCEECGKKIANRFYALRVPLESGGWIGCYCGATCADSSIEASPEIKTFRRVLLDVAIDYLEIIGITNRIDDIS